MLLNQLSQQFVIHFDYNFFYPDICERWMPVLRRKYLPYNTMEDFINSQITQITFPGAGSPDMTQRVGPYDVKKRPGFQMDQIATKTLTLNIKNTESYIAYFVMRQQYDLFLKLGEVKPLYMGDLVVSLLDDGGFETVSYVYKQLSMTSIGDLNLQYSAQLGNFNTFSCQFDFNFYDVYLSDDSGRHRISTDYLTQKDAQMEFLDNEKNINRGVPRHVPVSTKSKLRELAQDFHPIRKGIDAGMLVTQLPEKK